VLSEWNVSNFKSIGRPIKLPLAPLTLFVGANSSGKSSIIQSILLLKQTFSSTIFDKAIALNGPLLKLGTFFDVKHAKARSDAITISFEIDLNKDRQHKSEGSGLVRSLAMSPYGNQFSSIKCDIRFTSSLSSKVELDALQPSVDIVSLKTLPSETLSRPAASFVTIRRRRNKKRSPATLAAFDYDVIRLSANAQTELRETRPLGTIVGAALRHFLPVTVGVQFDEGLQRARAVANLLSGMTSIIRPDRALREEILPLNAVTLLREWYADCQPETTTPSFSASRTRRLWDDDQLTVNQVRDINRSLRLKKRGVSARPKDLDIQLRDNLEAILVKEYTRVLKTEAARIPFVQDAAYFMTLYFDRRVLYLGPLRDEPKALYPLEAMADPTMVGFRGENTAAVLDLNRRSIVEYIPPPVDGGELQPQNPFRTDTLQHAVASWLR
jgi:hypothetical protein